MADPVTRQTKSCRSSVRNRTYKATPWLIPTAVRWLLLPLPLSLPLHQRSHRHRPNVRQPSDFNSGGTQFETRRHQRLSWVLRVSCCVLQENSSTATWICCDEFVLHVPPTILLRHITISVKKFKYKIIIDNLGLISNLMHKILIYLRIIHLLKSSTSFEH